MDFFLPQFSGLNVHIAVRESNTQAYGNKF